jgi:hypothetical protein
MTRILTLLLLTSGLAASTAAQAAGTVESANTTATVGFAMGVAGPPAMMVGGISMFAGAFGTAGGSNTDTFFALGGFTVLGLGAGSTLVGPPLQAGASVAGAHRASLVGVEVDPTLGYWAWGLWGGSMLSGTVASSIASAAKPKYSSAIMTGGTVAFIGGYVGSLTAGRLQTRRNEAALAHAPRETKRVQLALVPMRRGAALTGRF